ncbi:MAG TPA: hypothetical protein VMU64_01865 [Acidimicrobiales bacterium]|nr:hypothetical protein [Acidimicrobiales bacterium]
MESRTAYPSQAEWAAGRDGEKDEGAGRAEQQSAVADMDGQLGQGTRQEVLQELVRTERDRPQSWWGPAAGVGAVSGGDCSYPEVDGLSLSLAEASSPLLGVFSPVSPLAPSARPFLNSD